MIASVFYFFTTTSNGFTQMVGHWSFDEVSIDVTNDDEELFPATLYNGVTHVTEGFSGKALGFNLNNESDQYAEVDPGSAKNPESISIEMYVNLVSDDRGIYRLIYKEGDYDIHLWNADPQGASFRYMLGTKNQLWSSRVLAEPKNMFDGNWHQLAMSYDASTGAFKAYWDNKIVGKAKLDQSGVRNSGHKLYFGTGYWADAPQQAGIANIDQITISGDVIDFTATFVSGILNSNNAFWFYPNPANDLITVQTSEPGEYSITITSLNGQIIHSRISAGTSHQIDLSSFQKGVYFITVWSKDFVTTEKIIRL